MLGASKLVAFVPTSDGARARTFYEGILGLGVLSEDELALRLEAGGTEVRVTKVGQFTPFPFTILGWETPNLQSVVGALATAGVHCEHFPGLEQNREGIWRPPSGGQLVWFKDPDGNLLSVHQPT